MYDQRPNDKDLLVPAVQIHEQRLHRAPELVAGDAGFYSAQGEAIIQDMGVKRVSIPNHSTKSTERRRHPQIVLDISEHPSSIAILGDFPPPRILNVPR